MSIPEQAAIRCAGLQKRYGATEALKGLDLTVPTHSIFGLLGPNGVGKSTIMKLLTRQFAPTSGQAWIAGAPITGKAIDVRDRIGYLSEQPAFYSWMTGYEFLNFAGELFGTFLLLNLAVFIFFALSLAVTLFASALFRNAIAAGGLAFVVFLAINILTGLNSTIAQALPSSLFSAERVTQLLAGTASLGNILPPLGIGLGLTLAFIIAACLVFQRQEI